ncbi:hypothetical protein [Catenulispora subtropica]|uniref:Uncharacterized protein n=1 Tax=Catenulispora subtropica TaxID=450798 RepID=A0ABN2S1U7_9ACTN
MIAGETLVVKYRFRSRAERGPRTAREIEQDIRRRERELRSRCGRAPGGERAAYLAVSPLDGASYR